MRKKIAILGSTGSIGQQTLEVLSMFPELFQVELLTAHQNVDLFLHQMQRFRPTWAFLHHEQSNLLLMQQMHQSQTRVLADENDLFHLLEEEPFDVVVLAYVGIHGLKPAYHVIKRGKKLALANKEVLVAGGEFIMRLVKQTGATILPIDSEHSAIFQCLAGEQVSSVHKLIITASGGPFLGKSREDLVHVTLNDALAHPTWKMGNKITIDSATLMNKGFEVIEAHWLFDIPPQQIEVVIHPQSIIHSMVQFVDGSFKAQLSLPDMRIPILYALSYPDRFKAPLLQQNVSDFPPLQFLKPDLDVFLHLKLAYEALKIGSAACCVLNAANDYAVSLFLENKISFLDMQKMVVKAFEKLSHLQISSLDEVMELYQQTVHYCRSLNQG